MHLRGFADGDHRYLWQVLGQLAGGVPGRLVQGEEVASRYVDGFGMSETDVGVLGFDDEGGTCLGAAWMRMLPYPSNGFAYIDNDTPEIVVALALPHDEVAGHGVEPEHVENMLLCTLLRRIRMHRPALIQVAASAVIDSPSNKLYTRAGFATVPMATFVGHAGKQSYAMIYNLAGGVPVLPFTDGPDPDGPHGDGDGDMASESSTAACVEPEIPLNNQAKCVVS